MLQQEGLSGQLSSVADEKNHLPTAVAWDQSRRPASAVTDLKIAKKKKKELQDCGNNHFNNPILHFISFKNNREKRNVFESRPWLYAMLLQELRSLWSKNKKKKTSDNR